MLLIPVILFLLKSAFLVDCVWALFKERRFRRKSLDQPDNDDNDDRYFLFNLQG